MSQKPGLSNLPTELLLHIAGFLSSQDLSSFSRLGRQFHWRLFHLLIDSALAKRSDPRQPGQCTLNLFSHAVKLDSVNLVQYLIYSTNQINLNGPILTSRTRFPRDFTFLHFALLADAPRVAAELMKSGADINQDVEDYPDLTPLYLTLPRSLASSPKELDSALRIACSYALPRTTSFLLTRGANANTANKYGIAAIHMAVMRRYPWRKFRIVDYILSPHFYVRESRWESMLLQTVSKLLDFGAEIDLRTRTSRTHECGSQCWRSIDCDHQGQTALHIASASGRLAIVSLLLDAGADPNLSDEQGYTALYAALVQGHKDVACHIMKHCDGPVNPIVYIHDQTTALHIACRFNFLQMVDNLLGSGADANAVDCYGRTPLHDVLTWARLDREEEVILTLDHLAKSGADPDITTHRQTPRQLAESHASTRVRDMFSTLKENVVHRARRNVSSHNLSVPEGVRKNVRCSAGQCELSGSAKSRRKAGGPKLPQDSFPDPADSGKDQVETMITVPTGRMEFMLEKSVWAPYKTAQFVKGLEASTKTPDQDHAKVVVREPFPELIAKASRNATNATTSVGPGWSETKTAQLIKGLETRAPPSKLAPQPQKSAEAFPSLREPVEIGVKAVVPGILNAEATQSWAKLTKQTASALEETVIDKCEDMKEPRAEIARTKTSRNRRRWAPLQL